LKRFRPRAVLLFALTVLLSITAFGGVQLLDELSANAANCRGATSCAPTAGTTTTTTTRIRRPAAVASSVADSWFVARPPTTPPTVPPTAPPSPVPDPTTCAGVVSAIPWPPGWRVECGGSHPGLLGATEPGGVTNLFVRSGESMSRLRVVALHESGHAWDFARLDPPRITQWCATRGCDAEHFFSGATDEAGWAEPSGAEDWAAAWDVCHGGEYHRSYLGLAAPVPSQCALQERLVGYPG